MEYLYSFFVEKYLFFNRYCIIYYLCDILKSVMHVEREIEYQEEFKNTRVLKDSISIEYVMSQIREVHSPEFGWEVSEPTITPNDDGVTVTLVCKLTKYKVNSKTR